MEEILKDFNQTITALKEVLAIKKNDITRDSALLRFQLCFELAWKAIKSRAKSEGVECFSPKSCFQTAFQLNLVDYDENWLTMVNDRNLIVHLYEENVADQIYGRLSSYIPLFEKLYEKLNLNNGAD